MNINPIAFQIGSFPIYWYGISYCISFVLGAKIAKHLIAKTYYWMSGKNLEKLVSYIVIGMMVGGRIGYCLLYDFNNILNDPISIFMVRKGGMSFHGAIIGIVCALFLFKKKFSFSIYRLFDLVATAGSLGIFFGRIGNFINQEHVGRPTNQIWGVVFERIDMIARHPVQIYEALLEGLIPFLILFKSYEKNFQNPGKNAGLFLIFYAFARCFLEFFRTPDGYVGILTLGQFLSLPMFVVGWLFLRLSKRSLKS